MVSCIGMCRATEEVRNLVMNGEEALGLPGGS
jgi:hypothetical protein